MVKSINPGRETVPLFWRVHMSRCSIMCARHESGMVGVDVRGLNVDEALRVISGGPQPLPKQLRNMSTIRAWKLGNRSNSYGQPSDRWG